MVTRTAAPPTAASRRLALLALGMALSGCGDTDARSTNTGNLSRYALSGRVTVDGQPVTSGSVRFEPDVGNGNEGPTVVAPINDGRYATPNGEGTVGGPHLITVESPQLSGPFDTAAHIPEQDGATHDIEVPPTHQR